MRGFMGPFGPIAPGDPIGIPIPGPPIMCGPGGPPGSPMLFWSGFEYLWRKSKLGGPLGLLSYCGPGLVGRY